MKSGPFAAMALAGLLTLAPWLAACGRDEKAPPPPSTSPPAVAAAVEKVNVLTPDDEVTVSFQLDPEEVRIVFTEGEEKRVLRSRLSVRGDRRYHERGQGPVALVRSNPKVKAFTVRSPAGELRWRVRLARTIAIGDHPEKSSFELRQPQGNYVRVLAEDGTELGRVRFRFQRSQVKVRDAQGNLVYQGKIRHGSAMYGVLLVPDLDPVERYVLMAELLLRQR